MVSARFRARRDALVEAAPGTEMEAMESEFVNHKRSHR
jgi:hypothetical protein